MHDAFNFTHAITKKIANWIVKIKMFFLNYKNLLNYIEIYVCGIEIFYILGARNFLQLQVHFMRYVFILLTVSRQNKTNNLDQFLKLVSFLSKILNALCLISFVIKKNASIFLKNRLIFCHNYCLHNDTYVNNKLIEIIQICFNYRLWPILEPDRIPSV